MFFHLFSNQTYIYIYIVAIIYDNFYRVCESNIPKYVDYKVYNYIYKLPDTSICGFIIKPLKLCVILKQFYTRYGRLIFSSNAFFLERKFSYTLKKYTYYIHLANTTMHKLYILCM